jgi:NTP pyrophosphatase (non-canonical NTP hydrolase)
MDILKLQHEAWKIAEDIGWHQGRKIEFGEFIALCHSELSEALEVYRETGEIGIVRIQNVDSEIFGKTKPEGIPIELADVIIRILDYCETHGIPMFQAIEMKMNYNKLRSHRHGNKVI